MFVGTPKGMEKKLVTQAGFDFAAVDVRGFQRKISFSNIKRNAVALIRVFTSSAQAKKIIKNFAPDLAIGTGGYVSGPAIRACQKLGIKTAIHEQNSFPGITTKMLCKNADAVMLASEDAAKHLPEGLKYELIGNPIRQEFFDTTKQQARQELSIPLDKKVILSYGGSLGARRVNEAAAHVIANKISDKSFHFIHAYGQYGSFMPPLLKEKGVDLSAFNLDLREYINNMPKCMLAADLVICRSGAITISELSACGKASVLIPSPNVSENHQYFNALSLKSRDAAVLIEEKDLSGELLLDTVNKLFFEKNMLEKLSENSKNAAVLNTNERIYAILKNLMP